jgi:hypothetical protein
MKDQPSITCNKIVFAYVTATKTCRRWLESFDKYTVSGADYGTDARISYISNKIVFAYDNKYCGGWERITEIVHKLMDVVHLTEYPKYLGVQSETKWRCTFVQSCLDMTYEQPNYLSIHLLVMSGRKHIRGSDGVTNLSRWWNNPQSFSRPVHRALLS